MFTQYIKRITTTLAITTFICSSTQLLASEGEPAVEEVLPNFQKEVDKIINNGKLSLFGGIDVTTAYYSRGQKYEDRGVIIQPWVGVNVNIFNEPETNDFVKSLDVYGLWWGSIHGNRTDASNSPESFYESDYIFGVTAGLDGGFTFNSEYWYETSPNGGWDEIHDLFLKLSYDDAEFWKSAGFEYPGFSGLQPFFKTCIRLNNEAPGSEEHGYFWLGINPTFDLLQSETIPVTFSTPVTVGFGDGDFYGKGSGNDDFGYIDTGIRASAPLDFISDEFGNWSGYVGFHLQYIGEDARTNRTWMPIGCFGLSFSY
ncbi:hypothetical protein JD969_04765 [Planctomycetota bacterium]|nr:hypothetical protein JD969_04765 [Planctomycetota bacterium]